MSDQINALIKDLNDMFEYKIKFINSQTITIYN